MSRSRSREQDTAAPAPRPADHGHDDRRFGRDGRRPDDRRRFDPRYRRRSATPQEDTKPSRPMSEFNEECCVRLGILNEPHLTRDAVRSELDLLHVAHEVDEIFVEAQSAAHPHHTWARIYFLSPDGADHCATELNLPGRNTRWRHFVTQRLPLPGAFSGPVGEHAAFEAFPQDPPDMIAVESQEGYLTFNTDELYRTKGLEDCVQAKRLGKSIRRLMCKNFDAERRLPCRYGPACTFIHAKPAGMERLLRTVGFKHPFRPPKKDDDTLISTWESERRDDALIVRDLEPAVGVQELRYMFGTCPGFTACLVKHTLADRPYGVIRFHSRQAAVGALTQMCGSGLNVSLFGTMEDARLLAFYERREAPPAVSVAQADASQRRAAPGAASARPKRSRSTSPAAPRGSGLPFPALSDGWVYGVSRRTQQYYFYHKHSKDKTTWKHPDTNESYSVRR